MKKRNLIAPILASLLLLSGCGNNASEDTYYTVTFSTGCSYTIDSVSVKEYDSIGMPSDPVRDGYTFLGWYTDINYNYRYDFTTSVNKNITLYAKWSDPLTYNISYHLLDGATNNNPATYTVEDSVTFIDASKDGYTFLGWYYESTYENKITSISKGSTGEVDLYAKFEIITYTITYHMDGGTNYEGNVTSYTVEDDVILSVPEQYKPGYSIFAGWYYDEQFNEEAGMGWNKGKTGNIDLYAKYCIPITYSIIFHNVDGLVNTNPTTFTCESNDVALVGVEKDAYTFVSWYLESDFRTPVDAVPAGTVGDFDVYAKFSPITYSITYNPMGGILNPNRVETYTIEDTVSLVDPISLKQGYTAFDCWCLDEELSNSVGTGWEPGTIFGDLTLYAKYKSPSSYSITYVGLVDGTTNSNPSSFTCEDEITLADPVATGYTFEGWYKESTFENEVTKIELGTTENISLYAKMTPTEYTITYHLDGGVNSDDNVSSYTLLDAVFLNNPKTLKTGYSSFAGWFYDSSFTEPVGNGWNVGKTGDVDLYAKYDDIITYTVTYELDGGTNDADNISSFTVETEEFTLEDPTREGWEFAGWFTDSEFKNRVYTIAGGQSENVTLYVRWKKNLNSISWDEIKAFSQAGIANKVFDIGDAKNLQINGQDKNTNGVIDNDEAFQFVRIIDFNHDYTNANDIENSKIGITFEFGNLISDADGYSIASIFQYVTDSGDAWYASGAYPNSTIRKNLVGEGNASESGWYTSEGQYDTGVSISVSRNTDWNNITVLDMLPSDMVDVLANPVKTVTCNIDYNWTTSNLNDKLFLPSMFEIRSEFSIKDRPVEGTLYSYYKENKYDNKFYKGSGKANTGHIWRNEITDIGFDASSFDPVSYAGYYYGGNLTPYGCYWTRTPEYMGCVYHIDGNIVRTQEEPRTAACFALSLAPCFCI